MLALKGKRVQDSREVFLRRELGCELGRDRRIESTIKTIQGIQGGSRQRTRKRKQRTVLKIKFYEEQEQQKLVTTISTEQNEAEPMESELMSLADKFDRMIDDDSVLQLSDEYCCSSTTSQPSPSASSLSSYESQFSSILGPKIQISEYLVYLSRLDKEPQSK